MKLALGCSFILFDSRGKFSPSPPPHRIYLKTSPQLLRFYLSRSRLSLGKVGQRWSEKLLREGGRRGGGRESIFATVLSASFERAGVASWLPAKSGLLQGNVTTDIHVAKDNPISYRGTEPESRKHKSHLSKWQRI